MDAMAKFVVKIDFETGDYICPEGKGILYTGSDN